MLESAGFRIQERKFDFFFGQITSTPRNQARSLQNLEDLARLGIRVETQGRDRLMQIFAAGLTASETSPRREDEYGVTIGRTVQVESEVAKGGIEIFYLYRDGDLSSIPEVTTIIPRIYR